MHTTVKKALRGLGLAIGLAALAYFFIAVARQVSSLPPITWGAGAALALAGAILANCCALLLSGYAWCLLLRLHAAPVRPAEGIIVFMLAQFARYLPGNIGHYASRVALGKSCSIPAAASTMSLLSELGWALITAASVAAACFGAADAAMLPAPVTLLPSRHHALCFAAAVAIPLLGAATALGWLRLRHGRQLGTGAHHLLACLAGCFFLYVMTFLLIGVAAAGLAAGVFGVKAVHVLLLTGAFAASWIAGLLAFGAPAGIGVRDVVLLGLLTPAFGPAIAGGLAAALRASSIAADGLMFLIACGISRNMGLFSVAGCGQSTREGK